MSRTRTLTLGAVVAGLLLAVSLGAYAYHVLTKPNGVANEIETLNAGAAHSQALRERSARRAGPVGMTAEEEAGATNMFNILNDIDASRVRTVGPLSAESRRELADPAARARLGEVLKPRGDDGLPGRPEPKPPAH